MPRVVWTEHRPKLEISNRLASWTDQLDHRMFTNRIYQSSWHHIFTPKKLMEMFPSNPSQSPHPKHWHLKVYWHRRWQTIWNSTMARSVEINFLHPKSGWWKPTIFRAHIDSTNPTNLSLRVKDLFNAWPPHFPGLNDFVPVVVCDWKFPSNLSQSRHPKHWHLRVYWHGGCGLVKASVPSRWYNAWCPIISASKKCLFLTKMW
jgi:hypothetical protein